MPHRPIIKVLHIMRVRPRFLVRNEWKHECHRFGETSAIGKRIGEKIVRGRRENLADSGHDVEVEKAVAVRFRAGELPREAAIRSDLLRHHGFLESLSTKLD